MLEVWGLDKVGMRFSSVRLIGQVLYGGGEKLRLHVPVVTVVMLESAGKLCTLCGVGCLTGLSSWGFMEWVNVSCKKGLVSAGICSEMFPFFVEGMYEVQFVWD